MVVLVMVDPWAIHPQEIIFKTTLHLYRACTCLILIAIILVIIAHISKIYLLICESPQNK